MITELMDLLDGNAISVLNQPQNRAILTYTMRAQLKLFRLGREKKRPCMIKLPLQPCLFQFTNVLFQSKLLRSYCFLFL